MSEDYEKLLLFKKRFDTCMGWLCLILKAGILMACGYLLGVRYPIVRAIHPADDLPARVEIDASGSGTLYWTDNSSWPIRIKWPDVVGTEDLLNKYSGSNIDFGSFYLGKEIPQPETPKSEEVPKQGE